MFVVSTMETALMKWSLRSKVHDFLLQIFFFFFFWRVKPFCFAIERCGECVQSAFLKSLSVAINHINLK